ncbi:DNA-binding transcriptional regulator BolA-like [Saccoglossus kowalevskii]|uniref:BolA-like protein 1-like n=1 Tax=Saccoglossus kowalevskii TaxID=10224 RepID=A0ABM0GLU3_SACKO|nr:PREDICTED: bolA-like protein 1-like [Saccoglossus kowalevskii]
MSSLRSIFSLIGRHRCVTHYCVSRNSSPAILRMMSSSSSPGPVATSIKNKLSEAFQPVHLQVINESHMHSVPKGSESHFKVVVISDKFDKQTLIKRHRMVNESLEEELKGPVHALSIQAKTPEQWHQSEVVSESPACLGGMKKENKNKS